jgi:hypothetical protein
VFAEPSSLHRFANQIRRPGAGPAGIAAAVAGQMASLCELAAETGLLGVAIADRLEHHELGHEHDHVQCAPKYENTLTSSQIRRLSPGVCKTVGLRSGAILPSLKSWR